MKVIFVTREGYNLPGGRVRAYKFSEGLRRRGIEAEVLSYADCLGAKSGVQEGSMRLTEKIKYNFMALRILEREKDSVIVIQRVNYHSFAPFFSRVSGKRRLILDLDDWEMREDPRYILGFYPTSKADYLTRRIAAVSDFCVGASRYLADYLKQCNRNVYYIPSCVDTGLYSPNGKADKPDGIGFSWIGTLYRKHDVQNVKFAVDCFTRLKDKYPDIYMDIAGGGIYAREVEAYCRAKDSVNFSGWIEPDRMPPYLDRVDICLFPLTQDTKFNMSKSPVKLFEYMAMEKPTVSSSIGEARCIIEDGKDGFLAGDQKRFVDRMEALVMDRGLRVEMGKNAREKILKSYSLDRAVDLYYKALRNAYS